MQVTHSLVGLMCWSHFCLIYKQAFPLTRLNGPTFKFYIHWLIWTTDCVLALTCVQPLTAAFQIPCKSYLTLQVFCILELPYMAGLLIFSTLLHYKPTLNQAMGASLVFMFTLLVCQSFSSLIECPRTNVYPQCMYVHVSNGYVYLHCTLIKCCTFLFADERFTVQWDKVINIDHLDGM